MKSLVTGVAGFIGSHLAEKLVKEGHDVVGIDVFAPYYSKELKKDNIKKLLKNKKFTFIQEDILKTDLKKLLKNIDLVFHLAAQAGVRASWGKYFKVYIDNNIYATQLLLETAKECRKLKKIIFASSSSIYGDTKDLPIREDTLPVPVSPYGVTKLAAEKLCSLYWKNYKVPAVSLRFFSVYGPRQRPDMAFNIFTRNIIQGKTINVFNEGNQTRDFTFVSDIVNGIVLSLKEGVEGGVFNLGGGNRVSLMKVIKIIESILKIKAKIKMDAAQKGDVKDTWADISKAKRILKYNPQVNIEEGLKAEIDWIKGLKVKQ